MKFRIAWACLAITLFSGMLVLVVTFTLQSGPVIGWLPGIFITCLVLAFVALWVARLLLLVQELPTDGSEPEGLGRE